MEANMNKRNSVKLGSVALLAGLTVLPASAFPCGDKLIVVARGQRAGVGRNAPHRGAILLYANSGSSVAAAIKSAQLKKGLERAGHRVRTVTTRPDLRAALGSSTYDLVLADPQAVPDVAADMKGTPSASTVIPTMFDPSEADLKAARSGLTCVVKSKGTNSDYLSVVNGVLTERAKARESERDSKKS